MFMVHEAQAAPTQQGMTRMETDATNAMMNLNTERYIDILVNETTIKDRNEWEEMIRKTTWFNAKRALEIGMAHKIE